MSTPRARPLYHRNAIRRIFYGITSILVVMIVGAIGFHFIESMNYVDAVYFESMLATGQGPPLQLTSDSGKIFASVMAFVSVGSVTTTIVFTLGPIATRIWKEGLELLELEAGKLEKDLAGKREKTANEPEST